jgi:4,5-dihydroxyphthalate decarboxylase
MTTMAGTLTLRTAIGPYGFFKPLKEGGLSPDGVKFDHVEVEPIRNAFRMQCRNQEFDVSEMAIVTYLLARDYGLPFIGLPVFCVRNFWHGAYSYNVNSGIKGPKDVEGKTGAVRAYTQTSGVWARGVLQDDYGVDLSKINWILADEEHVQDFHKNQPSNIRYEIGKDLGKAIAAGEIDFAMGVGGGRGSEPNPDIKPLIPDARAAGEDWHKRTGLYPIDHMIVMKQEVVDQHPWLADALFETFKEAKRQWQAEGPNEPDRNTLAGSSLPGDRFPYGIEQNALTINKVVELSKQQNIIRRSLSIDELFVPSTLKS